jgi:hypothetical protein
MVKFWVMLGQVMCEQVWVLDTGIVGFDLTQPFAEVLTVEARLALDSAPEGPTNQPEGVTYLPPRARFERPAGGR